MLNVAVSGRLATDPEVKVFGDDKSICEFTVVTNRYDSKADDKRGSDFFQCKCWGKRGRSFAEFFKKGDGVVLSGTLETEKWQDKNGQNRSKPVIKVVDWEFPIARKDSNGGADTEADPF